MKRADRRVVVASMSDRGPVRSAVRRRFLGVRAVRRALEGLPPTGVVAVAGPRRALLVAAVAHGAPGRRGVPVDDVRAPWPRCDAALLVDALLEHDRSTQEAALRAALAAVAPGGTLTVVEVDGARTLRSALARVRVRRRGRRAGADSVRTVRAWAALLAELGGGDVRLTPSPRLRVVDARGSVRVGVPASGAVGPGPVPAAAPPAPTPPARPATRPAARRCVLCGGLRRRVALRHADGTLLRCRDCGFVSVDPLPTAAEVLPQYDEAYFHGDRGYRDYAAEETAFRGVFRHRLARLRGFGARGTLLDVGTATGACLVEAQAAGFAVAGVEPCGWAAAAARSRGLDVTTGPVETLDPGRGPFDVVTAFDVVEHLVDPRAGLRTLARHVRPGGLVAVTVPDFGGAWARASGARWPFVTPREHLHYFTRRTLRAALRAAGLEVLEVSSAATPLSVGTALRETLGELGASLARALGRVADAGTPLPFGTLLGVARRPRGTATGPAVSPAASRGSGCR